MNSIKLYITQFGPSNWSASADLIEDDGAPSKYVAGASTLDELREMIRQGVSGDLGISEIVFDEVFLEYDWKSEEYATK
jgi:hypothetical protein